MLKSRLRRRAVLFASGTAVLLAVGGGTTAAFAAGSDRTPSASPSASASCTPHLGAVLHAAPAKLKTDLETLRKAPKDQRAADRKSIRTKALTGAYGGRSAELARIVGGGKAAKKAVAASLPAALKTDLQHLRTTTKPKTEERKTAAAAIVTNAEHGKYGSAVQQRVQQRQQQCEARQAKSSK